MIVEVIPTIVRWYSQASFVFITHNQAQRADLMRHAAAHGIEHNLYLLGTIGEEEKLARLRASDVLPFPSRYEGFGLPLLEGMAAGVPVISTDIPVVNEIIVHSENDLLIPYDDTDALVHAILSVLVDQRVRERLIAGGQRTLNERFTSERLVRPIIAVYEKVLAGR
ncbi:glycosyltransferase family 4 protein [Chloroflexus sp.]|uniref:glycosyltransferase family 4 protein n=1 Tax=Chloroflexus sp. TaxID=1904827 RepID=UPI0040498BCA